VAIPAQGMTITWGGVSLVEVREIELNQERGLPLQRDGTWTLSLGTVRLASFSTAVLAESEYGRRKQLEVLCRASTATAAPVVNLFSRDCIFMDRIAAVQVNDAVRFDYAFRIMDTVGAPSNP